MSILLDALKRSEEQRQLGSTPNIHSPGERWPSTAAVAHQWIPITLMAFSAIAMAWVGWHQYRQPEYSAVAPAEVASVTVPAPGQGATVDAVPGGASAEPPVSSAAEARAQSPGPDDTAGSGAIAQAAGDGRRTPVETLHPDGEPAQGVNVPPPRDAPQTEPRRTGVNESFTRFAADSQAGSSQQEAAAQAGPEVVSNPPTRAQEDSAGVAETQPHVAEPISYWELPQGIRDSLPEMHISVLVYAESPADRFVLVSGQRMVEQDEYQDVIVLDEIRRDGAVFLYRKYRFLVKG